MNVLHTLPAAALLLSTGCASLSGEQGFGAVAQATQERIGQQGRLLRTDDDRKALAGLLDRKLAQPLSAEGAVEIALLNNRGLQATYWSLGVAEADLVQAGRLANPGFGFKRTHGGGETAIERTLTLNLVQLITMPLASRIEARRFEQVRLSVANEALKVAADTRRAWYEAVAALHSQEYARQVRDAAEAGAELGQRMRKAGNWSALDAAREQSFHADAVAELARADRAVLNTREKLARLLGVPPAGGQGTASAPEAAGAGSGFTLPAHLPELPAAPRQLAQAEQAAMRNRLDIQAAQLDAGHTAASLGLTRGTRFINVLELGIIRERAGAEAARGYEISLEVPLFDWGQARGARAEAVYMQAVNRLAETASNARSEARESYADYRASFDLARHYRDTVIPLRRQISQETLLRYNGMLASVFELLADAREQSTAVNAYINALKDFWLADAGLEAALGGKLAAHAPTPAENGVKP